MNKKIKVTLRDFTGIVDKEMYITAKWKDLRRSVPSLTRDIVASQLDAILKDNMVTYPFIATFIRDDKPEKV